MTAFIHYSIQITKYRWIIQLTMVNGRNIQLITSRGSGFSSSSLSVVAFSLERRQGLSPRRAVTFEEKEGDTPTLMVQPSLEVTRQLKPQCAYMKLKNKHISSNLVGQHFFMQSRRHIIYNWTYSVTMNFFYLKMFSFYACSWTAESLTAWRGNTAEWHALNVVIPVYHVIIGKA